MKAALRIALLAVLASTVTSPALAIEKQHHLGLAPALGVLSVKNKSTADVGIGGALHYTYGLTDQWNIGVEVSSVVVAANQKQDTPDSPKNRPATIDNGALGISYVIDILRWIPYIGVTGGVYRVAGGTVPDALIIPGASIGGGLDYQISRSFAVGLGIRQHFMISKLKDYPSYTMGLLRFEYMWGY